MTDLQDLVASLRERLGGVEAPAMGTDNLAIALATYFDDGSEPNLHPAWSNAAINGADATLDAIHAHYAAALEALQGERDEARAQRDEYRNERDNLSTIVATAIDEVAGAALDDAEASLAAALSEAERLRELVEQSFRDGLQYATNVVVTDPDEAWRTSRIRAALQQGGV